MTAPDSTDPRLEDAAAVPETTVPAREGPAWRRRALLAAVAVLGMLLGAGAATGVILVTGLPVQPVHRFTVNVYLKTDTTADQKAAIEAALPAFEPTGEVKFTSRDEAWRKFQEAFKDQPDLLKRSKKEYLPESFGLETKGRLFDCTGYTKVRHLPGVDKVQVIQHRVNGYGATIVCDAEYAKP